MQNADDFDRFWQAYPRRVGKGDARRAFGKAIGKTSLAVILKALEWQRHQPGWMKDGGEFIPHPSTWLNQERWDDEPFQAPQISDKTLRNMKAIYGD